MSSSSYAKNFSPQQGQGFRPCGRMCEPGRNISSPIYLKGSFPEISEKNNEYGCVKVRKNQEMEQEASVLYYVPCSAGGTDNSFEDQGIGTQ